MLLVGIEICEMIIVDSKPIKLKLVKTLVKTKQLKLIIIKIKN